MMDSNGYKISRLLLKNIVESIASLAGEEALVTIFNIASHKTAIELLSLHQSDKMENIKDPVDAFKTAYSLLRKYLKFELEGIENREGDIVIRVRSCECIFSTPEMKIMDKVKEILRSQKLCILTLLACSLVELLSGHVYVIKDMVCQNGNADIELTHELL